MTKILTNPFVIILSCIAGVLTAAFAPEVAKTIEPIGSLYLRILKMCVLPIIVSAVISSVGKLLDTSSNNYIKKMLLLYAGFTILSCVVGIAGSIGTAKVLGFDESLRTSIGSLMVDDEFGSGENFQSIYTIDSRIPAEESKNSGFISFAQKVIPVNIFNSLSSESTLQAVFFFLLFSLMLKYVTQDQRKQVILFAEAVFAVMQKLIQGVLYLLPFALWSLLANQFSTLNSDVALTLACFIAMTIFASSIILALSVIVIWHSSGKGLFSQIAILKAPILIAMSTRSSFPTLPAALTALVDEMKLDKGKTNLSVSLGHTLCKYGKTMVFCIGSIFSLYLYQVPIDLVNVILIFILSIFAGIAASGAPSIISRTMIALVLSPLGVPSEAVIVIMLAVDPIIDPIITLVSTYPNYAVAAALSCECADSGVSVAKPSSEVQVLN